MRLIDKLQLGKCSRKDNEMGDNCGKNKKVPREREFRKTRDRLVGSQRAKTDWFGNASICLSADELPRNAVCKGKRAMVSHDGPGEMRGSDGECR